MLHREDLQNDVVQSNTIQYCCHVIAYYYLPLLYLPHKRKNMNVYVPPLSRVPQSSVPPQRL